MGLIAIVFLDQAYCSSDGLLYTKGKGHAVASAGKSVHMGDRTTLELICRSGHKSQHLKDRVLRHDDAWCPKCGADIKFDPEGDPGCLLTLPQEIGAA